MCVINARFYGLFSMVDGRWLHGGGGVVQMMEFYERVSGARMHAAYVRPGGVDRVSRALAPTLEPVVSTG